MSPLPSLKPRRVVAALERAGFVVIRIVGSHYQLFNERTRRLHIGKGYIENVTPEMWAYEVSGKQVLCHWFSYRDRSRPVIGDRRPPSPLDSTCSFPAPNIASFARRDRLMQDWFHFEAMRFRR